MDSRSCLNRFLVSGSMASILLWYQATSMSFILVTGVTVIVSSPGRVELVLAPPIAPSCIVAVKTCSSGWCCWGAMESKRCRGSSIQSLILSWVSNDELTPLSES